MVNITLVLFVGDEAYVVFPAGIFDGRRPGAASIAEFSVQQVGLVVVFKLIIYVRNDLPVDQVGTVHHRHTRKQVHSGACHIIVISNPDDVGIGNICVDYGIGS